MQLTPNIAEELQKLRNDDFLTNKEKIIPILSDLLINAVKKRLSDKPIGIAFSGGVDSTLIAFLCDKLNQPFTLYSVGFEDSKDIISSEEVAKHFGWKRKVKILTIEDIEQLCKQVIKITGRTDVITVGVGSVDIAVLSMMDEDIIFTGLGSEEIFAGYERHRDNIHEACWEGILKIYDRDLIRDLTIGKHYNKELRTPFLDKELIEYGMRIDPKLKVQEFKKQILRETAVHLGLPEKFAFRKKSAAQYGSKIDNAIAKLAKKKGLLKNEYLATLI
ncbi:MAG: asparagine synthase-related protein, partial [Nanoarchaeota archaeon]|nr:asparagine synthase-related protein [Nanoarchaeota archaeon]